MAYAIALGNTIAAAVRPAITLKRNTTDTGGVVFVLFKFMLSLYLNSGRFSIIYTESLGLCLPPKNIA